MFGLGGWVEHSFLFGWRIEWVGLDIILTPLESITHGTHVSSFFSSFISFPAGLTCQFLYLLLPPLFCSYHLPHWGHRLLWLPGRPPHLWSPNRPPPHPLLCSLAPSSCWMCTASAHAAATAARCSPLACAPAAPLHDAAARCSHSPARPPPAPQCHRYFTRSRSPHRRSRCSFLRHLARTTPLARPHGRRRVTGLILSPQFGGMERTHI